MTVFGTVAAIVGVAVIAGGIVVIFNRARIASSYDRRMGDDRAAAWMFSKGYMTFVGVFMCGMGIAMICVGLLGS